MRTTNRISQRCTVLGALLFAGNALAGSSDADRCEADKLKRTGGHALCQMKAQSKFARTDDPGKLAIGLSKCDFKITDKFAKAEAQYGAQCPTMGDVSTVQSQVSGDTHDLSVFLSTGVLPPVCGNGTIETGEDCDFGDLAGETCDSQTFGAAPAGTLGCSQATCTFDTSACTARFEDTGLTVIDHLTGLEWEKKTGTLGVAEACPGGANCGDPNDVNNLYSWANGGQAYDGTAKTLFLNTLNDVAGGGTSCFAGHCDWRLPSLARPDAYGVVDQEEWDSIVDCSGGAPCIDPDFGATASEKYWASTPSSSGPWASWTVDFLDNSQGIVPFVDVYRTFCVVPSAFARGVLEGF